MVVSLLLVVSMIDVIVVVVWMAWSVEKGVGIVVSREIRLVMSD